MNTIRRTLITGAAIVGLSACTTQQRLMLDNAAQEDTPVETTVPVVEPSMAYQADCTGVTITTDGWPDGSSGILGINGEPPYNVPLNTTGHWAPAVAVIGGYGYDISARGPGVVNQAVNSVVSCGPPAPPQTASADWLP